MTYQSPCSSPDTDSNDWFISRDGKQYPDDDFLSEGEISGLTKSVLPIEGETAEEHRDRVDAALAVASGERRRLALISRRQAKDKCHTDCYFRTQCLTRALDEGQDHGTWGGYYEEELREIRKEIARRKKSRSTTTPEE
jgi:hypothetical protein